MHLGAYLLGFIDVSKLRISKLMSLSMAAQLPRQPLAPTFVSLLFYLFILIFQNQIFFFEIKLCQLILVANFMIHLSER